MHKWLRGSLGPARRPLACSHQRVCAGHIHDWRGLHRRHRLSGYRHCSHSRGRSGYDHSRNDYHQCYGNWSGGSPSGWNADDRPAWRTRGERCAAGGELRSVKLFRLEAPELGGLLVGLGLGIAVLIVGVAEGLHPLQLLIVACVAIFGSAIGIYLGWLFRTKILRTRSRHRR